MEKRYAVLWFRHLITDRMKRQNPALKEKAFVASSRERGRIIVKAASREAEEMGIAVNMVLADCRAIFPALLACEYKPAEMQKVLYAMAEWCIQFTPDVCLDPPDGLVLHITGCTHLWGGEQAYADNLYHKFSSLGYDVRIGIAGTIGTAWAVSRHIAQPLIVPPHAERKALQQLPPSALRIEEIIGDKLKKLGLYRIGNFIDMPAKVLRRRFGEVLLSRIDQALGLKPEFISPIKPGMPYLEALPSLEPVRTAEGIRVAIGILLEKICTRLSKEEKGLRTCLLKTFRIDGQVQIIEIGTSKASVNMLHLMKLFELKIPTIAPGLGIELFVMEAPVVEMLGAVQDMLWTHQHHDQRAVGEMIDKIAQRIGTRALCRYLPDEHYLPERSVKKANSLLEEPQCEWRSALPRPIRLLAKPELIDVVAPIPDYPPMIFRYKGIQHKVSKADGPERIEQAWWIEEGLFRDYYCIEDEEGKRYWLFRAGCYERDHPLWYLHGFFA